MPDPLDWIDDEAGAWARKGLGRRLVSWSGASPGRLDRGGRSLLNFASNDYLGLATDPRVVEAARQATQAHGWGSGASPLVSGWRDVHEELALALADFEGTEAVALFPSGYAANLGAITAMVGLGDAVYLDRLNHACLIDGAKLSGARLRVYPHADAARLGKILDRDRGRFRRSMIATDGVFSMDGDLAPLGKLADLADEFGAMLLVDEAHGTGVFGETGRGATEACGVDGRVHIKVGTLSKALGSIGGFVAGSRRLVDWLVNHARTMIYSTALPPAAAAAALAALAIARAESSRRLRATAWGSMFGQSLPSMGLPRVVNGGTIIPVMLGEPARAVEASSRLLAMGFVVPAIRPPTVPKGTARLRVSLTAAHSIADIGQLLDALSESIGPGPGGDVPTLGA